MGNDAGLFPGGIYHRWVLNPAAGVPRAFRCSVGGLGMVGPRPKVLVVDDDPAGRRFLRVALKVGGFSVFEAGSAGTVATAVASIHPDAIILDLGLPNGLRPRGNEHGLGGPARG